jgi:hypothetical protein
MVEGEERACFQCHGTANSGCTHRNKRRQIGGRLRRTWALKVQILSRTGIILRPAGQARLRSKRGCESSRFYSQILRMGAKRGSGNVSSSAHKVLLLPIFPPTITQTGCDHFFMNASRGWLLGHQAIC